MIHGTRWKCDGNCNTFVTIGQPTCCPYCGSNEVELHEPETIIYWRAEEYYETDVETPDGNTR